MKKNYAYKVDDKYFKELNSINSEYDTKKEPVKNISKNKIEFKNTEQMLQELNGKQMSNYHIVDCPCCNEHEAYVYESNMNVIKCSRLNECGETTVVNYGEKQVKKIYDQTDKKSNDRSQLNTTFNILLDKQGKYEKHMRVKEYRGLGENETVDIYDLNNIQNLPDVDTKGFIQLLKKQGSNFATDFNKRNIVHALRNEK
ncbi:MAG: hypothetical protein ACK5NF_00970, partial [Bacilli bacterium]